MPRKSTRKSKILTELNFDKILTNSIYDLQFVPIDNLKHIGDGDLEPAIEVQDVPVLLAGKDRVSVLHAPINQGTIVVLSKLTGKRHVWTREHLVSATRVRGATGPLVDSKFSAGAAEVRFLAGIGFTHVAKACANPEEVLEFIRGALALEPLPRPPRIYFADSDGDNETELVTELRVATGGVFDLKLGCLSLDRSTASRLAAWAQPRLARPRW